MGFVCLTEQHVGAGCPGFDLANAKIESADEKSLADICSELQVCV